MLFLILAFHIIHTYCTLNSDINLLKTRHIPSNAFHCLIGTGYDITNGEQLLPFLNMTYDDPHNIFRSDTGKLYLIPDKVTLIINPSNKSNTMIFENGLDYLNYLPLTYSYAPATLFNKDPNSISNFEFEFNKYKVTLVTHQHDILTLKVKDDHIDNFVQSLITKYLPLTYDYAIYKQFIINFGTDVILEASIGCKFEMTVQIFQCNVLNGIDLNSNAALYLYKAIYSNEYQKKNFSGNFLKYSKASTVSMMGGDPILINTTDWSKRLQTCSDYPVITNLKLKPITDFIASSTIKLNLQQAINTYKNEKQQLITQAKTKYMESIQNNPLAISFVGTLKQRYYYNNNTYRTTITSIMNFNPKEKESISTEISPTDSMKPLITIYAPKHNSFHCTRYNSTHIQATVDKNRITQFNNNYGSHANVLGFDIIVEKGELVSAGCSHAIYKKKLDTLHSTAVIDIIHGYCCTQCVQITSPARFGLSYNGCQCAGI